MAEETIVRSEPVDADKTLKEIKTAEGWRVDIVKDDRSISRLCIIDRQMRIGSCPVYTGGIAGVGTHDRTQSRSFAPSYGSLVGANAARGLRRLNPLRYTGFLPQIRLCHLHARAPLYLLTRDAERAQKCMRMRAMRPADLATIKRIYNRDNGARTASVVRPYGALRDGLFFRYRGQNPSRAR